MLPAKRPSESATEMVQVVLPNDANPLGYILGGTVMHLIDIAGAIACHRHTRSLLVTAAVDGLQFLHPIKVGDLIILKALVTAVWSTSLEVEVEVFSEETLTGVRRMTSRAFLTFVAIDREGHRLPIPGLILETAGGETARGRRRPPAGRAAQGEERARGPPGSRLVMPAGAPRPDVERERAERVSLVSGAWRRGPPRAPAFAP